MAVAYKNSACCTDSALEEQLKGFLLDKFSASPPAREHFFGLLQSYNSSGLAEKKLFSEILASCQTGNEGKFWENVWEAMIYRHICYLKYPFINPCKSGKDKLGPDFCFSHNQKKIWIEATSLNPGQNFPSGWLDAAEGQVRSMPHEAMLLRWTNALKAKKEQLDEWIKNGIVANDDPCVIAINSSQLSRWPSEDWGISQLPWVVEAVSPVGPPVMSNGAIRHSARLSIKKSTIANVPTAIFLDPAYNKVSAVIGCARNHMLDNKRYTEDNCSVNEQHYPNDEYFLAVVHNPLAQNPCPQKIFGNFVEYTMKEENDSWAITRIQ